MGPEHGGVKCCRAGDPHGKATTPLLSAKDFCPSSPHTDQVTQRLFEQLQFRKGNFVPVLNINLELTDMTVHI